MILLAHILTAAISLIRPKAHVNRISAIMLAVLIASCTPSVFKDDHIEVGTILSKEVLGITPLDTVCLVNATTDGFSYLTSDVAGLVSASADNVILSPEADAALRQTYADIVYRVNSRLCIRRTTEGYLIDREPFNLLRIGVIAKFKLNPENTAIDSLIAY